MSPSPGPPRFSRKGTISSVPGRPLTTTQEGVLAALVSLCGRPGWAASAAEVGAICKKTTGAVTLALRGLESRGLVLMHTRKPARYMPSFAGRVKARGLRRPSTGG